MRSRDELALEKAARYLAVAEEFKLGDLPTEKAHPESARLSTYAIEDLPRALRILKGIDDAALQVFTARIDRLRDLYDSIRRTLASGGRIFLCGCGATGRLSLALETLWRQQFAADPGLSGRVVSFMAGGDLALIKSIENFEDYPAFAERQLQELGFVEGDLLVSCTEGGETPWVIGATEIALQLSRNRPFFLYCNGDEVLCRTVERSRRVIENPEIEKICLDVGPMAITGSTRMQASTVLMAAVGVALLNFQQPPEEIDRWVDTFVNTWCGVEIEFLQPFIEYESCCYERGEYLLYETAPELGISVLTDTTERAPTFSLLPFESANEPEKPLSWCYLYFPSAADSNSGWQQLLRRSPRALEWPEISGIASLHRLLGFDFSRTLLPRRLDLSSDAPHHSFRIEGESGGFRFSLGEIFHEVASNDLDRLGTHLVLKMVLNSHSTLIMGRLGRYKGNVMTWVKASNNKLIDRSIRYIELLLNDRGLSFSYETICRRLFQVKEGLPEDRPLVLEVVESFLQEEPGRAE